MRNNYDEHHPCQNDRGKLKGQIPHWQRTEKERSTFPHRVREHPIFELFFI
jgi:hypothetical protein